MSSVRLLGIVNCTPDSFSDGGSFFAPAAAIARVHDQLETGAYAVDIGGDASGPGSVCTGPEEEWRRIAPVLAACAASHRVSVDTHHASTAQKAIEAGCWMINDVAGGMDADMMPLIARSNVLYTCMYSCWEAPHVFGAGAGEKTVTAIEAFFTERLAQLKKHGVSDEQIVLDPGMGGFLGSDPALSLAVLAAIPRLCRFGFPLLLGISRKRFLRSLVNIAMTDRDGRSAEVAAQVVQRCPKTAQLYFRVHEISPHMNRLAHLPGATIETDCAKLLNSTRDE